MKILQYKFMNNSWHGLIKNKSSWNNLIVFHNAITHFLERRDPLTAKGFLWYSWHSANRKIRKEKGEKKRAITEEFYGRSCISSWHHSKWARIQWLPSGSIDLQVYWTSPLLLDFSVLVVWNKQSFPAPFDLKLPATKWEAISTSL